MHHSDSNPNVLDLIAEEFVARFRRGERPSIGEYEARYPEHAGEIRDILPALVVMEQLKPTSDSLPPTEIAEGSSQLNTMERLDDFRIVREIGRGGMGIVYEAVQESLGRQVALKVLPRQLGGDSGRRDRFEREARAAARLHHTNIVPVFGVGDVDGLHFYAMQYIHGVGLDEVLEEVRRQRVPSEPRVSTGQDGSNVRTPVERVRVAERRAVSASMTEALLTGHFGNKESPAGGLVSGTENSDSAGELRAARERDATRAAGTLTDRIAMTRHSSDSMSWPGSSERSSSRGMYCKNVARIGVQVGEALQYAHDQGVLHRDIKPSNLLLDTRGTVWVTDFGLAKAHDQPELTRTGDVLGTLRYMAPEAFNGKTDRRGDVYSLGLTLYEMLALRPAFDEADRGRLIRMVANETPPRLRTLDPTIPRDLEMVIHKAIDRDPGHRYASAQEFVDDLERYLRDEPVKARRASSARRLIQWCKRNRMVASLSAVATMLLVLATGGAIGAVIHLNAVFSDRAIALEKARQARETARQEKEAADQARDEADRAQDRERTLREEAERHRDRAIVNFERARRTVDRYLSQITDKQLLSVPGLQPLRQELLAEALQFYGEFTREQQNDTEIQIELAKAQHRLSTILREVGDAVRAPMANREAIKQLEQLRERQLGQIEVEIALAEAYSMAGRYDEAVAVCERLLQQNPDLVSVRSTLAETYNSMALQSQPQRSVAEALELHQKAFAIRRVLVEENPDSAEFNAELAATVNNIGVLLADQNQTREALAMYELATTYSERAGELAPYVVLWGRWHAQGERNVGATLRKLGRASQALERYQRNVDVRRRLASQNPAVASLHKELYQDIIQLAELQKEAGRSDDSSRSYREALETLLQMPRATAEDYFQLAVVHAELVARTKGTSDGVDEGVAALVGGPSVMSAIRALEKAVDLGWVDAERLKNTAVLASLREYPQFVQLEAEIAAIARANQLATAGGKTEEERFANRRQAVETLEAFVAESQENRRARKTLATQLLELGAQLIPLKSYDEAEERLQRSIALYRTLRETDVEDNTLQGNLGSALVALGEVAWKRQQIDESRERWKEGLEHLHAAAGRLAESNASPSLVMARIRRVYELYGEAGLWDLACGYVERELKGKDVGDPVWAANFSYVLAATGRNEEHARICRALAAQWTEQTADRAIWAALMSREPVLPSADLIRMADKVLPKTENPMTQFRLASAYFQGGEPARAYERMRELLPQVDKGGGSAYLHLYALVCHALGNVEEREKYFQQGEEKYLLLVKKCLDMPAEGAVALSRGGYWYALAEDRVLRERAWAVIRKNPTPLDPWWHLVQARAHGFAREFARTDQETTTAVAAAPHDVDVRRAMMRGLEERGASESSIEAAWEKVVELAGTNPMPWIQRGRWYAERGQRAKAEADYARAAALTPDELNKFLEAGWWVIGPYPPGISEFCPPELAADPAQPATVADPRTGLSPSPAAWKHVDTGDFGRINAGPVVGATSNATTYALTHVYSPNDMTATLCLSATKEARVWINGELHHHFDPKVVLNTWSRDPCRMPIALRAGLNSILIKSFPDSELTVRLGDHPYDQGMELARYGLWKEAADRLEEGLRRSNEAYLHEYPLRCLAAFRAAAGEVEAVRKLYEELVEHHREPPWPFWNYAFAQIGSLAPGIAADEALLLRRAEAMRGDANPWIRVIVPMVYARLGRWQDVVDFLELDERCRTQSAEAASLLAMAYHHLGRASEAEAWLARALATEPALSEWSGRICMSGALLALLLPREASVAATGSGEDVERKLAEYYQRRREKRATFRRETFDFDAAVQVYPQQAWLRVARGRRHAELGEFALARGDFDKAVELAPQDRYSSIERAAFLAETGKKEQAADEFWRALHIPYAGHEDWFVAGRMVETRLMQYEEVLEELLCRWPENSALHRLHGERLARLGRWKEAAASYSTGAPYWSHSFVASQLAVLLNEPEAYERERARAREMIREIFASSPEWRVTFEVMVECAREVSKEEGARWVEQVRQAVNLDAMPVETRLALGLAEYRAGFHEASLNNAIQGVAPAHRWHIDAMSWPLRAMAHWQLGQQDLARDCLRRSFDYLSLMRRATHELDIHGGPMTQDHYWMLAVVLHHEATSLIDGPDAAAAELLKWRQFDERASPRNVRANRIQASLDAALARTPQDARCWLRRAQWHAARGELGRAADDFAEALGLSPDDAGILKARARFLARQGRLKEAVADFARAHGRSSDHPVGMLLEALEGQHVAAHWNCAAQNPRLPGLQHCAIQQRDGVFVVRSVGDQPSLSCNWSTPAGEKEWWVCARFQGESLEATLSWGTPQDPTFTQASAAFPMEQKQGQWHVYRARFRPQQEATGFRFSFANRPDVELEIAWVALINR